MVGSTALATAWIWLSRAARFIGRAAAVGWAEGREAERTRLNTRLAADIHTVIDRGAQLHPDQQR
jgi:hypothetical protein